MRRIPPLVTAEIIGWRQAYLLEWQRLPAIDGGGWAARICWVETDEHGAWYARGGSAIWYLFASASTAALASVAAC